MRFAILVVVAVAAACGSDRAPRSKDAAVLQRLPIVGDAGHDARGPRLLPAEMLAIDAGTVYGRESRCGLDLSKLPAIQYIRQSVEAYRIDARTVDCAEWTDCRKRGACPADEADSCNYGKAFVSWKSAAAYCAQRDAVLPTWAQWLRAVRADGQNEFQEDPTECKQRYKQRYADESMTRRGCMIASRVGFVVTFENPNEGEWTGDSDCYQDTRVPLAMYLGGRNLGLWSETSKAAEFRCAEVHATSR